MRRPGRDAGTATAELAVAVPVLVVVLAVGLAAVRLGADRVRAVDAAHTGARLVARGEPVPAARHAALAVAAPGALLEISVAGEQVHAVVTTPVPALLVRLGVRPGAPAVATARLEPGTGGVTTTGGVVTTEAGS